MKNNLKVAYSFIKEAEKGVPPITQEQARRVCKKLWTAWAQATKVYKRWKSLKDYSAVIGELYHKYPNYAQLVRMVHFLAWTLLF